jgi:hypothetical protein
MPLPGYTAFIATIGLPPEASAANAKIEVTPTTLNMDQ